MWGTSGNDIYVVGALGGIAHYDGSNWQKLNSGTAIDLLDVYGSPGGEVVWACGFTDFVGTILLKFTGSAVETVYEDIDNWSNIRQDSLSGRLVGVWANDPGKIYVMSNAGMYIANADTRGEAERIWFNDDFTPGFPRAFHGQKSNDMFTGGDFSFLAHYNGNSWRHYNHLTGRIRTRGISIQGNFAIAVGVDNNTQRAIVITGNR